MTYIQMNAHREQYRDLLRAADRHRATHPEPARLLGRLSRFVRSM